MVSVLKVEVELCKTATVIAVVVVVGEVVVVERVEIEVDVWKCQFWKLLRRQEMDA